MPQAYYPSLLVSFRLRFDEASGFFDVDEPDSVRAHAAQPVAPGSRISNLPLFLDGERDELTRVFNRVPKTGSVELAPYRQASRFNFTFPYQDVPIDPRLLRAVGVEIYLDAVSSSAFAAGMNEPRPAVGEQRSSLLVPSLDNLLFVGTCDQWEVTHDSDGSWIHVEGRDLRGILLDSPADPGLFVSMDLSQPIDDVVRQIIAQHPMLTPRKPGEVDAMTPSAKNTVVAPKADLVVAANPNEWPGGIIPSPLSKDGVTRVRLVAQGKNGSKVVSPLKGIPKGMQETADASGPAQLYYQNPGEPLSPVQVVQQKQAGGVRHHFKADPNQINFWDLITQYCFLVGAIPYFHGQELRIRPSRSLYDTLDRAGFDKNFPTPFKNNAFRQDGSEQPRNYRRMIYGKDIQRHRIVRRFNGFRPRIVEVVSIDTSSPKKSEQRLISAQWPEDLVVAKVVKRNNQHHKPRYKFTNVSPSGFRTEAEIIRFPVAGINDEDKLRDIARGIFEELMRGEVSGQVTTKDLASFGGSNDDDADLVRLRPGDPIEFLTDIRPVGPGNAVANELINHASRSYQQEVEALTKILGGDTPTTGDRNFAALLVATSRKMIDLLSFFRVNGVTFRWDATSGVTADIDFQNYLEVRFGRPSGAPNSGTADTHPKKQRPQTKPSEAPAAAQSDVAKIRETSSKSAVFDTSLSPQQIRKLRESRAITWGRPKRKSGDTDSVMDDLLSGRSLIYDYWKKHNGGSG